MHKYKTQLPFRIIAVAIFFLKISTHGQDLSYKQYSVKDGLPGPTVYQALQDRNGFIWFATNQGVSRFDGRNFVNYSKEDGLPEDEIIKLYLDRHDHVWFISLLGIPSVFYNDSIIRFADCQGVRAICEDMITDSIHLISEVPKSNSLNIYAIYRSVNKPGHWKFTGKFGRDPRGWQVLRASSPKKINFYFTSANEKSELLLKNSTGTIRHFLTMSGEHPFTSRSFSSLSDNEERIAFHTLDSLYCADVYGIYPILSLKEHRLKEINFILYENDSTLWLCTRDRGLVCLKNFLTPHKTVHTFFAKSFCTSIIKDQEQGYWVTTHSDGVYYLPNLCFYAWSAHPDINTKDIKCIGPLSTNLTGAGFADGNILLIDNENLSSKLFPEWTSRNRNKRILDIQPLDAKNFIVAGDCGIMRFSEGKPNEIIGSNAAVKGVYVAPDATLIVGLHSGTHSIKMNGDKMSNGQLERIFAGRVTCVTGLGKKYYWGTLFGLYTCSEGITENLGKRHPELSNVINHIDLAPDSTLWVSTQEGVAILKNNTVISLRREQGVASNTCKHVSFDSQTAWISTNRGISRVDYSWSGTHLNYSISNITEEDGLTTNDVNQTTPGGAHMWAATARGISFFTKDFVSHSALSPLINITGIMAGEKKLAVSDTIVLSYPANTLRLELSGISYRSGRQMHYEYRLNSLNSKWSKLVNNVAEFPALPFGQFVFEVRAVDRWGKKSDRPKSIVIINNGPFWETTLFGIFTYLTTASLLGMSFYMVYRWQHKKKEHEYQLKKKMHDLEIKALRAQMNPHFIFNCLTSIQYHIMRSDADSANIYLHKFSTLIRQILQHSTSSTILLREEIKILDLYLQLEKLRLGEKMDYSIDLTAEPGTEDVYIPSMIVQPYVENAIKHGISPLKDRKGILSIRFIRSDDYVECFIEDNGPGISTPGKKETSPLSDHHVSMGTTITANRINTLNNLRQKKIMLNITNKLESRDHNSGTIVHLSFPILIE